MEDLNERLNQQDTSHAPIGQGKTAKTVRRIVGTVVVAGLAVGATMGIVRHSNKIDSTLREKTGISLVEQRDAQGIVDLIKEKVAYSKNPAELLESIAVYSAQEAGATPATSQVYVSAIIDKMNTEPASVDSAVSRLVSFMGENGYAKRMWDSMNPDARKRIVHENYFSLFTPQEQKYLGERAGAMSFDKKPNEVMQKGKNVIDGLVGTYHDEAKEIYNRATDLVHPNRKQEQEQVFPELMQPQQPSGQYNTQVPSPENGSGAFSGK